MARLSANERDGRGRGRPLLVLVFALVALAAALVVIAVARREPPEAGAPAPRRPAGKAAQPTRPRPEPMATRSATPVPEHEVIHHLAVTLPWTPEATPTPFPTLPPRPGPAPTRPVTSCLALRWSVDRAASPIGGILIDIEVANHCGREVRPLDVWFVVTGYRFGEAVQSVEGHLFDPLYTNGVGRTAIDLPGSPDWYDAIEAHLIEPMPPQPPSR